MKSRLGAALAAVSLVSAAQAAPPALTELGSFSGAFAPPAAKEPASSPISFQPKGAATSFFQIRLGARSTEPKLAFSLGFDGAAAKSTSAERVLAKAGITVGDVTDGTKLEIVDLAHDVYGGQAARAVSGDNVLTQTGGGGAPVSFTLKLAKPVRSFKFSRAALIAGPSGIAHPQWRAIVFNRLGHVVDVIEEPMIRSFSDVPAKAFSVDMDYEGIAAVRFESDGRHFAAFNAVLLDDLAAK